jgi:LysR family transcriptional regulator for bpeEF and oprC
LRVDVPTLMARSVFVPALPQFFSLYPDIELALACSERRADLIEEGIDCAVWSGEIEESNFVARRVGFLYFATCAAPSYIAKYGRPEPLLAAHGQADRLGLLEKRHARSNFTAGPHCPRG